MTDPLYRIVRQPNVTSITKDAEIKYSCLGPKTYTAYANRPWGYAEGVRWFRKGEREIGWWDRRTHHLGFGWDKVHKFESLDPGRYMIFAVVQGGRAGQKGLVLGPVYQYVMKDDEVEAILSKLVAKARKNHLADPNQALKIIDKNINLLNKIEKDARYPLTKEQKEQHDNTIKKWRKHRSEVKKRLSSTDSRKKGRIPIYAVHIDYKTQEKRQLNFFLVHMKTEGKREYWKLVDWTNPSVRAESSESDGDGNGAEEALEDVFSEWDWWRGRYPPGTIMFQLPKEICGKVITKKLETDGKTTWESMIGWLQTGAMVAAGVATLVAPIPGSRAASVAIWSTIFSSATGAASEIIAMGQRRAEGIYNAREDTYSWLSIAGDLFTAGAARWVKGATVIAKAGKGAKAQKYIFIGSVTGAAGTDVARGVLILEEKIKKYDEIMNDKTLLPEERAQRLRNIFRTLALNGAMIYIGIKGAKGDLASVASKRGHPKLKGSTGLDDSSADLKRLTKEGGEPIDTTKRPKTKGRADHGETRTTVTTRKRTPLTGSTPGFREKYPDDKTIWRIHTLEDKHIQLQHFRKYPSGKRGTHKSPEQDDFWFEATMNDKGYLYVDIQVKKGEVRSDIFKFEVLPNGKKSTAKPLFDDMFRHFRNAGHETKGWHGYLIKENYKAIRAAEKAAKKEGRKLSLKDAVLHHSKTGPLWVDWANRNGYELVFEKIYRIPGIGVKFKVKFVKK